MPRERKLRAGDVYVIPDDGNYYYACIGVGGDVLFLDETARSPEVPVRPIRFFLRLPVSYPSIKRAGWVKIASIPAEGLIAESGKYIYRVGANGDESIYDIETGKIQKKDDRIYEELAAWDAEYHIVPILRYHFFNEETPFRKMIRANI